MLIYTRPHVTSSTVILCAVLNVVNTSTPVASTDFESDYGTNTVPPFNK